MPRGQTQVQGDSGVTAGADALSSSAAGGLGGFVNRLRDSFSARHAAPGKGDEPGAAGSEVHIAANGDAVEMVTFMETVSDDEAMLDPGAAYQMVALRRPTLAQSGIDPCEAQFLLDQANAMLQQPRPQQLMQDTALTALADGIVLW